MKTINKIMTQEEIYTLACALMSQFENFEMRMPAAITYAIQKNKKLFASIAQEIEQNRYDILNHYGTLQEDGQFIVSKENIDKANEELHNLLQIQEEVKIYVFTLEDLQSIEFTMAQMDTLMFMIDDNE